VKAAWQPCGSYQQILGFLRFGGLWRLVVGFAPSRIRVVFPHGFAEGFGLLAEILLIDNAILVHDNVITPEERYSAG
jgi:hypothetical protein